MRYRKAYKLHEIDRDAGRYAGLSLKGDKLVATDGRVLAVVPVEERAEGDKDGPVPAELLKLVAKDKRKSVPCGNIDLADEKEATAELRHIKSTMPRRITDSVPEQWKQVIPAPDSDGEIVLNARYLRNLVDALGIMDDPDEQVKLTFSIKDGKLDAGAAVRVEPAAEGNEAVGVIMPVNK